MGTNKSIKGKSEAVKYFEKLAGQSLSFGQLLEAIRMGDEVSQVDFAKRLKISRSHLCDIEKGRKLVSPARAAEFAKILGYSQPQLVRLALQDEVAKAGLHLTVKVEVA